MEVVRDPKQARLVVQQLQRKGRTLGLVPTMGYLHAGHGALIDAAVAECDDVVVTIFVNPTQFGPQEDLSRYPRDLPRDLALVQSRGAQWAFVPEVADIYPTGASAPATVVVPPVALTSGLCGEFRPGHFTGVATVVAKLFALWQPQQAYFGLKDFQQTAVIKALVRDLLLPVEVKTIPTVREPDGLALSSRNVYLSALERQQALMISRALHAAWETAQTSGATPGEVVASAEALLAKEPAVVLQYLKLVDEATLELATDLSRPAVLALAAWVGTTRLIDNITLRGASPLTALMDKVKGERACQSN